MYSILITDDEQIVVDSLFFILNRNFEGQVKLYSANSGAAAIDIVTRNHIDIIFMDINMPGMTGLESVKCILNLNPQAVVIILSAFDTFQYAQEALNLGAYKYLTKPINRNVVVQTVRAAMNTVDVRKSESPEEAELRQKLEKISPVLESDFFYSCIFNRSKSVDAYTFLDYFKIKSENFALSCIELCSENENETLYQKIKDELHRETKCFVSSLMMNRIIVFFWFDGQEVKTYLEGLFSSLCELSENQIKIGTSGVFSDISKIADVYRRTQDLLSGHEQISFLDEAASGKAAVENEKTSFEEEADAILVRLYNRLKIGDGAGVSLSIHSYFELLEKNSVELEAIKAFVFEILVNTKNVLEGLDENFESLSAPEVWRSLKYSSDKNSVLEYLEHILGKASFKLHEVKKKKKNPVIVKVLSYLEEHLSESISLEQAASCAGVNSFYLSKLFREETGDTFVNYVTDKRLEMGKGLLSSTSLSVKEITAEIGYNDQNYFSKLFKAKYGISPTDFRKIDLEN